MSQSLILLNDEPNGLWRRYISDSGADEKVIINLQGPYEFGRYPYYRNYIGWRRWFKQHQIEQVYCYQPNKKSAIILAAAARAKLEINIHLTGFIDQDLLSGLKLICRYVNRFLCAGEFIAQQIRRSGIDQRQIIVEIPEVKIASITKTRQRKIRREFERDGLGPLVLALHRPSNRRALIPLIWSSAMLRRIIKGFTLVLAGNCAQTEKRYFRHWEQMLDASGTIYFDRNQNSWDELAAVCDLLATGSERLSEVMRLLHGKAADKPIVAGAVPYAEFLADYDGAKLLRSVRPRQLSGAMLELLGADANALG